jgi:prefoldin subunit 5
MSDDTSDLQAQVSALQSQVSALEGQVAEIQQQLAGLTDDGDDDVPFPAGGSGP